MNYETIEFTAEGAVAVITLNRPEQLNALSERMTHELHAALTAADEDPALRAVLLRANGRAFSSGADLKEGFERGMAEGGFKLGDPLRANYHPLITLMRRIEMPVVCAVQGLAAGAGCSLALNADMVLAGHSGGFQQIFSNIALVPDAGSTYLLPRLAGRAKALGAMLTGQAIDAETAERWGLIWQVVADDELASTSLELAGTLAERPTRALAWTRALVDEGAHNDLATQLEREANAQDQCQQNADFEEAIQAFMQKRPARFTGR